MRDYGGEKSHVMAEMIPTSWRNAGFKILEICDIVILHSSILRYHLEIKEDDRHDQSRGVGYDQAYA
jgi:hypothetical protein